MSACFRSLVAFIHSRRNHAGFCFGIPRLALMFGIYEHASCMSALDVRTNALAQMFVMCEQSQMLKPDKPSALVKAVGISRSYACEILAGARTPSDKLAIEIYRATGWKTAQLTHLTDKEIATLEKLVARRAVA